jgi:hypothetical protein
VSTYEPTYLLTLSWGGRVWRLCTGDAEVTVDRGTGVVDTFAPGLDEAPGWEEVVDPLQQVPSGGSAVVSADLGVDPTGTGWPLRLLADGHLHFRARASLEVRIGGVVEVLLYSARIAKLAAGAPDQPPGWVSLSLLTSGLPVGGPLASLSAVVDGDALPSPGTDYQYAADGQLMPTVYGRPGTHIDATGTVYVPGLKAWPCYVIPGLDVWRLIVGDSPVYTGTVRIFDGAGSYEDLPVESWADSDGILWPTVDTSGSAVLDLQSTQWLAAYTSGATTAPDTWRGGDLGQLGPLVTWACCSLGLSMLPLPGDGWERVAVAWVADSTEGTVLDLLVDVLLPSWPLALVRRARDWGLVQLAPSSWPTQPLPLEVGVQCEAAGPIQTVGAAEDMASHVQVTYGLDADAAPLGMLEVALPGAEIQLGERRVALLALRAVIERAGAEASARAWGEVRWRPWLAVEVQVPYSTRPPRAGEVRLLTDARLGSARRALVSIVRAARLGWSITLLVPA